MNRRSFLTQCAAGAAGLAFASPLLGTEKSSPPDDRPNILWLSCEDISPHLGAYGYENAITPALDKMAENGTLFENAFTTSPVCAPNRSSIITGVYSTTLGTHHMRSGGSGTKYNVEPERPSQISLFTEYLRKSGYYCTNNGKHDYNFSTPPDAWDESGGDAHWRNRPDNRPFFSVFNFGGTHEGSIRRSGEAHRKHTKRLQPSERQDPQELSPPPYYPDTPLVRQEWAEYYELITNLDYWVSDMLQQLEEDGLAENTIVFFWSDHGVGLPRAKRWPYDSGTHIPLIVRIPEPYRQTPRSRPGTRVEEVVSSIDLGPTVLNLAGADVPDYMQGQPFLGAGRPPNREYAFASRDRMDERYDIIRTVRDKQFLYVRNYQPYKPYHQFMNTPESGRFTQHMHELADNNELPPGADWFTAERKPVEELYDTHEDPHQINNLADNPKYQDVLQRMRKAHTDWMIGTRDLGLIPEPELVTRAKKLGTRYAILRQPDSDNQAYMHDLRAAASLAGRPSQTDLPELRQLYHSNDAAIRWWACTGIGNLNDKGRTAADLMEQGLNDSVPVVRVAAAHALFKMDRRTDTAMPILIDELKSEHEWVRLHAATALDAIGDRAEPAIPALKEALNDVHNKYVVRVANRALNQILGTDNRVR